MAADNAAAWPHDGETPLFDDRSAPKTAPKPALARPATTRQTGRKGRLNFLYSGKKVIALAVGDGAFQGAVRARIDGNYLVFGGVASTPSSTNNFLAGRIIIDTVFDNGFD